MTCKKYAVTETTVLGWAEPFECVRVWLRKLNGAKTLRLLSLWYFCDWIKLNPAELLSLKASFENLDVERLLDRFVVDADYPESSKWKTTLAVKSFFRCNYKQLQAEAGRMEYVQQKPQRVPSKAQRLELYRACFNPRDRMLVLMATCSAIALETLSRLRWLHFEEGWMRQDVPHVSIPSELLKGHGKGKYRGVRQETFITPECKRELLEYRSWMTKRFGWMWSDGDNVFMTVEAPHTRLTYEGFTNAVMRISQAARVPFSIHDGRRVVETALENVSTPRNWVQKIKGRKVRGEDAPYSKPAVEMLRGKYREALGELQFLGEAGAGELEGLTGEDIAELRKLLDYAKQGKIRFT